MENNNKDVIKTEEPEAAARYEKISYWEVAWGQIKKNKVAVFGLWCIILFILVAIYSPFVSMSKPYYFSYGGKTEYPFFTALFDRNYFQNGVDIFFNLLMVLSPIFLIIYFIFKLNMGKKFKNIQFNLIGIFFLIQIAIFVLLSIFPRFEPYRDYRAEIETLEAEGEHPSALFPFFQYGYHESKTDESVQPPSWEHHWMGTDKEGRDVFARMVYGARISMSIGVVAVSIYVLIGILLGATAGYFGGAVDLWITRLIEIMICFPSFFLILTIVSFIEKKTIFHIMFVIGLTHWTGVARLVRAEFMKLRNMDYVQAAIALGLDKTRIMFGHILPNAMAPVLVSATFGVAAAILTESSLSFLGLGDPSAASWGEMLNIGRVEGKIWLILSPGLAIFFVVSIFNLVGEALRDALDPRLRQ